MSKLLQTPRLTSSIHRSAFCLLLSPPLPVPIPNRLRPGLLLPNHLRLIHFSFPSYNFTARTRTYSSVVRASFDSSDGAPETETQTGTTTSEPPPPSSEAPKTNEDKYPSGEFLFKEYGWWTAFLVKLRMLVALPWERVRKGSVLTMKLRGQISDQLKSRFSSGLSLPQICENFEKAAYDPRISGIYLHIKPLNCGWGKVEELRRHSEFQAVGKSIDDLLLSLCH